MGLLDQILGAASGTPSGNQESNLGRAVIDLLGSPQVGGVQGLANLFEQGGLGNLVRSWIGTGANLPMSGEQVQAALGSDTVAALAQKVGIAPGQAQLVLAQLLPNLVDKLTPNGKVVQDQDFRQAGLNALKSLLA